MEIPNSQGATNLEEKITGKIRREILSLERELEKRITSRVKAEVYRNMSRAARDKKAENTPSEDI